jgi:hypothetical protein
MILFREKCIFKILPNHHKHKFQYKINSLRKYMLYISVKILFNEMRESKTPTKFLYTKQMRVKPKSKLNLKINGTMFWKIMIKMELNLKQHF